MRAAFPALHAVQATLPSPSKPASQKQAIAPAVEDALSVQGKHAVAPVAFTKVPASQMLQPVAAEVLE